MSRWRGERRGPRPSTRPRIARARSSLTSRRGRASGRAPHRRTFALQSQAGPGSRERRPGLVQRVARLRAALGRHPGHRGRGASSQRRDGDLERRTRGFAVRRGVFAHGGGARALPRPADSPAAEERAHLGGILRIGRSRQSAAVRGRSRPRSGSSVLQRAKPGPARRLPRRDLLPATFEELDRDFVVGAVDARGRHVLLDSGPLPEAVAASACVPLVFRGARGAERGTGRIRYT